MKLEAVDSVSPHVVSGAQHIRRHRECLVIVFGLSVVTLAWAYASPYEYLMLVMPLAALASAAVIYPTYLASRCPRCRQFFFADRNTPTPKRAALRWTGNPWRSECANCGLSLRAKLVDAA